MTQEHGRFWVIRRVSVLFAASAFSTLTATERVRSDGAAPWTEHPGLVQSLPSAGDGTRLFFFGPDPSARPSRSADQDQYNGKALIPPASCDVEGRWEDLWSARPRSYGEAPLDKNRFNHTLAATGTGVVVWGGRDAGPDGNALDDGAIYTEIDTTGGWTLLSQTGNIPPARWLHSAVWTGSKLIVWGGTDGSTVFGGGASYDPETSGWRAIDDIGAPSPRYGHVAVWTGSRMLVWGGATRSSGTVMPEDLSDGASYDPLTKKWSPVSMAGAPSARRGATAVWAGGRALIWGGVATIWGTDQALDDGAIYDPASDVWTPISTVDAPEARVGHSAVWTGNAMVIWGGWAASAIDPSAGGPTDTGGVYFPAADCWVPTPLPGAPSARINHGAMLYAGATVKIPRMWVWGGRGPGLDIQIPHGASGTVLVEPPRP